MQRDALKVKLAALCGVDVVFRRLAHRQALRGSTGLNPLIGMAPIRRRLPVAELQGSMAG